jgi:hypothetical protein
MTTGQKIAERCELEFFNHGRLPDTMRLAAAIDQAIADEQGQPGANELEKAAVHLRGAAAISDPDAAEPYLHIAEVLMKRAEDIRNRSGKAPA